MGVTGAAAASVLAVKACVVGVWLPERLLHGQTGKFPEISKPNHSVIL